MRDFDYVAPRDLVEATALLNERTSRALAGGTDLLTLMKGDIFAPERLVNIKGLSDMSGVSVTPDGIRIGALTSLAEIERHRAIRESWPALAEAASLAATPQLRNQATLGGNILQRPRCWYFRDSHVDCWLKGGDTCPLHDGENRFGAIFEDSPCSAVHPSDLAPVLVALDAVANVMGPGGETQLLVDELLQPPVEDRRTESVLDEPQLITSVWLPRPPEGTRMTYLKAMDRKVWAFALVSVAVSLQLREGTVARADVVFGGVSNVPRRAMSAASLLAGRQAGTADLDRVMDACFANATPLSQNGYKVRLGKALLGQALNQLLG